MLNILQDHNYVVQTREVQRFIRLYAKENNWHNIDINTANLGYGWLHYALIRNIQPQRVLVIGSQYGFIPAVCALACKHNNKGVVDFVDAGYDYNNKNHWGGVGFWKKKDIKKHFDAFKLSSYIRLHLVKTSDFFKRNNRQEWGYIHIDGDHSYKGASFDFNKSWAHLEYGGYISLHDIHCKQINELTLGVYKLWNKLKAKKIYSIIDFPGTYGLGIIQKYSKTI